jgi:hypothetical protein
VLRFIVGTDTWVVFLSFCAVAGGAKGRVEMTSKARSEKRFALVGLFTKAIVRENERVV